MSVLLDEKIQAKIDQLIDLAYEKRQAGQTDESFRLQQEAWDLFPEPKTNWSEAYNVPKYIYLDCMASKKFAEAKKWLNHMIEHNNVNHDYDGDLHFEIGKYKFETGSYEEALDYFMMAAKRGGGTRYFSGEDKKYGEFYKNPEKINAGLTRGRNKAEIKPKENFV